MKRFFFVSLLFTLLLLSTTALAQPESSKPTMMKEDQPPPPSTGFQMALRSGPMIPIGDAAKNASMGGDHGWQVPILVDLGAKVIPNLFLGGYVGLGFGGPSGKFAAACDAASATCVAASFRLGLEVQWHFSPSEKMNPWVGYGIGLESVAASGNANGQTVSQALAGPEFARLSGGLDFRINKTIGIGPLVDFSVGRYTHVSMEVANLKVERDIPDDVRATHFWLLVGGRMVVFP